MKIKNKKRGSILIEALLSIAIFALIILAVIPMISFLLKRTERSKYEGSAASLLQEGVEVAYNVLLSDWNCCSSSDSSYQIIQRGIGNGKTVWGLKIGQDIGLETRFDRNIFIKYACFDPKYNLVKRDVSTNLCPNGSVENLDAKVITAEVVWDELGKPKTITSDYLVLKEHLAK